MKLTRKQIKEKTPWLPDHWPSAARKTVLEMGYTPETMPRCRCGKMVAFRPGNPRVLKKSCDTCTQHIHNKTTPPPYEELFDLRINQRLSGMDIARIYGVSEPTAYGWLEIRGIPQVRYNESRDGVMGFLRDKEWLTQEHKEKHRTLADIAEEIGSTVPTLSRWMATHGIACNEPNGYDRSPNTISRECLEVVEFIRSLGFEPRVSVRSIIPPLELDIVIDEVGLAIEYNGLYSHIHRPWESTPASQKGPDYHLGKTLGCKEKGYRLIHIFSDTWKENPGGIKSMLRSVLGVNPRIPARKCRVIEVPRHIRKPFYDQNHIQGDGPATLALGLEYEGELVACMSFAPCRFNKKYAWELIRFASRGCTVVGGFSRLLAHFRKNHPGSIISYADRTYSEGDVYMKNGFTLVATHRPQYWYVDGNFNKRFHRAGFTKKALGMKDDPRPEWEIMAERGYHRIWGCGTLAFGIG